VEHSSVRDHPAIRIRGLGKSYGAFQALQGIHLEIRHGEILAFLGPNGAGKTTPINILTGLLRQDEGEIWYDGVRFDPQQLHHKRLIGVAPQHNNLDRDLTVGENLQVHGLLYGLRGRELDGRIGHVLDFTDLQDRRRQAVDELSGGLKRRLIIARALLHRPRILLLDEPSTGLDPISRRNVHALIRKLNREAGVSVLLTTHYIEEADSLASRVAFISNGRIVAAGCPEELKAGIGRYVLEYVEDDRYKTLCFAERAEAVRAAEQFPHDVHIREVTLEDVYIGLTGKKMENPHG
jgi:ABC-2 type transport system ATP-binding protein